MFSYIMSLRGEEIDIDLHSLNLDYTSFIYVNDESGNPVEYKAYMVVKATVFGWIIRIFRIYERCNGCH